MYICQRIIHIFRIFPVCAFVGKWHLGMSCDCRGDHCHHPNQQGFSFFYGLPYTLIDDCRPGEAQIYQAGFRQDFFQVALLVAVGLLTVV